MLARGYIICFKQLFLLHTWVLATGCSWLFEMMKRDIFVFTAALVGWNSSGGRSRHINYTRHKSAKLNVLTTTTKFKHTSNIYQVNFPLFLYYQFAFQMESSKIQTNWTSQCSRAQIRITRGKKADACWWEISNPASLLCIMHFYVWSIWWLIHVVLPFFM